MQASTIYSMVGSESRGRDLKIALHLGLAFAVAILFNTSFHSSELLICFSSAIFNLSTNSMKDSFAPCLILAKFCLGRQLSGVRSKVVFAPVAISCSVVSGSN